MTTIEELKDLRSEIKTIRQSINALDMGFKDLIMKIEREEMTIPIAIKPPIKHAMYTTADGKQNTICGAKLSLVHMIAPTLSDVNCHECNHRIIKTLI